MRCRHESRRQHGSALEDPRCSQLRLLQRLLVLKVRARCSVTQFTAKDHPRGVFTSEILITNRIIYLLS